MKTVRQTGKDLMSTANNADRAVIQNQLDDLEGLWNRTSKLCEKRTERLEDALKQVSNIYMKHKTITKIIFILSFRRNSYTNLYICYWNGCPTPR